MSDASRGHRPRVAFYSGRGRLRPRTALSILLPVPVQLAPLSETFQRHRCREDHPGSAPTVVPECSVGPYGSGGPATTCPSEYQDKSGQPMCQRAAIISHPRLPSGSCGRGRRLASARVVRLTLSMFGLKILVRNRTLGAAQDSGGRRLGGFVIYFEGEGPRRRSFTPARAVV